MNILFQSIWFMLPAALANMAPVLVKKKFNALAVPLDFRNYFIDDRRILGDHKTFRGLIFAIIFSVIGVFFQVLLYNFYFFKELSIINYSSINPIGLGALIGFSVMLGDAIGSFLKRRVDIAPGKIFFPVDQIDSGLALVICFLPFYKLEFWFGFCTVLLWFLGHLLINYLGWLLKIKKNKW